MNLLKNLIYYLWQFITQSDGWRKRLVYKMSHNGLSDKLQNDNILMTAALLVHWEGMSLHFPLGYMELKMFISLWSWYNVLHYFISNTLRLLSYLNTFFPKGMSFKIQWFSAFLSFFVCFEFKRQEETQREKWTSLVPFSNILNIWVGLGWCQVPRTPSVSHAGCRDPSTWAITCLLQDTLVGSWMGLVGNEVRK